MAANSKIEWTEETWNPVTGCTKISSGCKNCYAERMAKRLKAMGQPRYHNEFEVTLQPDLLDKPLSWKKPRKVFVNSMSDLFHEDVPTDYIKRVFEIMNNVPQHTFQVLTKRSERLRQLAPELNWTSNIWMGVTVEGGEVKNRIDDLREVNAAVKFISFEPLISEVKLETLAGIDWAIIGGESGPGARFMAEEWVDHIHEICEEDNVAFFFKQWGGVNKKKSGRLLHGQTWDEYPECK